MSTGGFATEGNPGRLRLLVSILGFPGNGDSHNLATRGLPKMDIGKSRTPHRHDSRPEAISHGYHHTNLINQPFVVDPHYFANRKLLVELLASWIRVRVRNNRIPQAVKDAYLHHVLISRPHKPAPEAGTIAALPKSGVALDSHRTKNWPRA
jgi:hypothetical protein